MDLIATVRRFVKFSAGPQRDLRLTTLESLSVAQMEPLRYEAARAGRRMTLGYSGAPTGIAPVQALATVSSHWAIFNADTTKAYAIEELGAFVASGTPGVGGTLYGSIYQLPANTGGSTNGIAVASSSNGGYASKAIVKSGVSISQPSAPVWFPIAENLSPNVAAFPGSGSFANREIKGSIVIPPQQGLALYVLAPAGTSPLFVPWGVWCELETDLE